MFACLLVCLLARGMHLALLFPMVGSRSPKWLVLQKCLRFQGLSMDGLDLSSPPQYWQRLDIRRVECSQVFHVVLNRGPSGLKHVLKQAVFCKTPGLKQVDIIVGRLQLNQAEQAEVNPNGSFLFTCETCSPLDLQITIDQSCFIFAVDIRSLKPTSCLTFA